MKNLKDFRFEYIYSELEDNLVADFVVDFTNDVIIEYYGKIKVEIENQRFSDIIRGLSEDLIYYQDSGDFLNFFSRNKNISVFIENFGSTEEYHAKKTRLKLEFRYKNKDGSTVWCLATLNCFKSESDVCAYIYIEDIDNQKKKLNELIFKSEHDPLTKLKNKSALETAINKYLVTKGSDGLHALFCFDIDNFKNINNAFGHVFGDVFLVEASNAVKRLFRKDDLIGRIGGDEFVIFMKDIEYRYIAFRRANEILESVKNVFVEHGEAFNTTISIGISFYDGNNKNYSELFKEADTAMYYCKNSGKNKYAEYNAEMDSTTLMKSGIDAGKSATVSEQNANEYIFRVLRDNSDKDKAFKLTLELICNYFEIDNASIFDAELNKFIYSYSLKGEDDYNFEKLNKLEFNEDYLNCFDDGVFFYPRTTENNPDVVKYFENAQCLSAIHFTFMHKNKNAGVICFNRYTTNRKFAMKDIASLRNLANLIYCRLFYM